MQSGKFLSAFVKYDCWKEAMISKLVEGLHKK